MAFRFIKQIGELEERAAEYVEHQGSQALIKIYKSSDDTAIRQEVLSLLKGMIITI